MLAFTSADIIFHKLLELHSSLSEKRIFVANFPFLTDSLKPLHPLNSQNPLSVTRFFCLCSLSRKISDKDLGASYAIVSQMVAIATSLSKLCTVMDLPQPVTITSYNCLM